jgi:RNA polymerase sigma-70 factor, ECF subfamily
MNAQDRHNLFAELITTHQSQLYGYIFALVRNRDDAADLFQSVCIVLWKKFDSFGSDDTAFFPWARQAAIFEVRNFLRSKKSPRHFTEELLDTFTDRDFRRQSDAAASYLDVLRSCKEKLTSADTELLEHHYGKDFSAQQIADHMGRSRQSVCNSLLRIRRWLLSCIRMQLARQEYSGEKHS